MSPAGVAHVLLLIGLGVYCATTTGTNEPVSSRPVGAGPSARTLATRDDSRAALKPRPLRGIVLTRSSARSEPEGWARSPRLAAHPLPLTAVRLTGGPLKHAQDLDARYLLTLEPDRMLAFYRKRAGLAPKAPPYGGWDGDGRNLTGHVAGHYLSAISLMWAATGDARFKQRADYIVSELKAVQDAQGDGYVGAIGGAREAFAAVSKGDIRSEPFDLNGLWSPWYTLHKTFAGLRDAYRYTANRMALDVEVKFADWAGRVLEPLDETQVQRMLNTEFGGMNEVLADLYADTGDRRWLALSSRFEHRAVLDPLKRGEDRLSGLHGNTQVPKLVGSATRYVYTGDAADRTAAAFFWDTVVHHHTFATGGHGKDEHFREPDHLGNIIDGRTAETCNVYNMLKLTRRLFAIDPDVEYAEFQERALFNHILASIDPEEGAMCYMVPVGRGVRREYQDMHRDFTCCVGTGMESHALHALGIYYVSGDRVWVNIYAPSTAAWDEAGVRLHMETDFPDGEQAELRLTTRQPRTFTLALRRPSWAGAGFEVRVNGSPARDVPAPGSYVELTRTWKTGDVVALTLPKALHLEPVHDNPDRAAVLWGPLVLAGDLGPAPVDGAQSAPAEAPMLVTAGTPVSHWLEPAPGSPGTFRTEGVTRGPEVELVPFYRLHRRTYAAYWDLVSPAEYEARMAERAAAQERQRRLELATIAFVPAGDAEREKPFNPRGERTTVVRADGRTGRRAGDWFAYDVPATSAAAALVVTYNSDTRRTRTFQILVNQASVAVQTIPESSRARFFDVTYPLAPEVVRGKRRLTIRFQAGRDSEVAPVFGVRIVRDAAVN